MHNLKKFIYNKKKLLCVYFFISLIVTILFGIQREGDKIFKNKCNYIVEVSFLTVGLINKPIKGLYDKSFNNTGIKLSNTDLIINGIENECEEKLNLAEKTIEKLNNLIFAVIEKNQRLKNENYIIGLSLNNHILKPIEIVLIKKNTYALKDYIMITISVIVLFILLSSYSFFKFISKK